MGAFLDKPETSKHNVYGKGNKIFYGVSAMQGWRCDMEDASFARIGLGIGLQEWSFFAVFDGHAGGKVSEYCAKHLLDFIITTEEFKSGDYEEGIKVGFLRIDEKMRELPELSSDTQICSSATVSTTAGTTVVCAFISPTIMYIANCGDSRAVMCRRNAPVFATQDHKPILPKERERIHKAGGKVMIKRVNGTLAVSRALGDYDFKNVKDKGQCEQLVSPEPEIFCQKRQDSDEFLVIACDGIWDVMTNEEVCNFIHSRMRITDDMVDVANQVIDTCLNKGSRDNMSVIIIAFHGAPKPNAEAIEADKQLEEEIQKLTRGILKELSVTEYSDVVEILQNKHISDLPPGGGLFSKYAVIERTFKEFYPNKECGIRNVLCDI